MTATKIYTGIIVVVMMNIDTIVNTFIQLPI